MKTRPIFTLFLCVLIVPFGAQSDSAHGPRTEMRVPDEIIVRIQSSGEHSRSTPEAEIHTILSILNQEVISIHPFRTERHLHLVRIIDPAKLESSIRTLNEHPAIEVAEPNFILHTQVETDNPNDPRLPDLWGLHDIEAPKLWQQGVTGSKNIVVAVIDTGIDWDHPDLKDNLYTNPGEIPDNGIDDDGNGFIDDIHGWNFIKNTPNSRDDNRHGTHCAGTIGARGNNALGVIGVNWNVSLLPIKFLGADGTGTTAHAIESINYATLMNVHLTSNSWGGGDYSEIVKRAIERARDAGIPFVAAAGNGKRNNDRRPYYPATYDIENVISVAALTSAGNLAGFSSYGATSVHLAAPGVGILSTIPGGKYGYLSGTSMATPHVAGVIALLMSVEPDLSPAEIKARLIETSPTVPAIRKRIRSTGKINAFNAVHHVIPPPLEPDERLWQDFTHRIESPHPYSGYKTYKYTIRHPGARHLRVFFDKISVEENFDDITIQNPQSGIRDHFTGSHQNVMSFSVEGDTLEIVLDTDADGNEWGFLSTRYQAIK